MCSYLGAEAVAVDAAKPRRRVKPAILASGVVGLLLIVVLAGCDGVTVDLGSNNQGGTLTGNDAPIVEEITWIDMSAEELIANYQQYIGQEVFVRKTVLVGKASPFVLVGDGKIKAELDNGEEFIQFLAVTDTVEVRGIVGGLDENGAIIINNAHMNVQFSCYPRLYAGNPGDPVTTGDNGIDTYGVGQASE